MLLPNSRPCLILFWPFSGESQKCVNLTLWTQQLALKRVWTTNVIANVIADVVTVDNEVPALGTYRPIEGAMQFDERYYLGLRRRRHI